MAGANHIAPDGQLLPASGVKPCRVCGLVKAAEHFSVSSRHRDGRNTICKSCNKEKYGYGTLSSEQRRQQNQKIAEWRRRHKYWLRPQQRADRVAYKREARRKAAEAAGRAYVPRPKCAASAPAKPIDLWKVNAHQAWRWWLANCPDDWLARYYEATGKPWNNPRLTSAEKFRIRYRTDDRFRAREVLKAQSRKVRRAERIAAQGDGTVTAVTLGALFAAATHCHYCRKPFASSVEKTADHVMPLMRGGAHSLSNLVIACFTCNTAKGRKTPEEWQESKHRPTCRSSTSSRRPTCSG